MATATPKPQRQLNGLDSLAAAAEGAAMAENPTAWIHETPAKDQGDEEEPSTANADNQSRAQNVDTPASANAASAQRGRNANGTIGSVYSGNKIKHLKKEDGTPLWRKDIQFAFLKAVFEDTKPVFTSFEDGTKGHSFADIYINAMAKSSKCSKVLRDKLLSDREPALNMAMICLLVNVGRMNTTLNFFPEMRAQLRTYHAIPCLQAHQDPNSAYKGLQDAPRLKSILKGSCEDTEQPNTIEKIQQTSIPRTNPVNLIFVLSQYAPKISELHFFQPRDFYDLIIRSTLSSKSRARAFLWLLWWYLESDFSDEAALNNPFGAGVPQEEPDGRPIKVPDFDYLDDAQAAAENVDTKEEQDYGWKMKEVRKRILENDEDFGPAVKKPAGRLGSPKIPKDEVQESPMVSRSPSPSSMPLSLNKARGLGPDSHSMGKRPHGRISLKLGKDRTFTSSSPAPPGPGHTVFSTVHATPHSRRNRPETTHQRAVHANKQMRIAKILHAKMREDQKGIVEKNRHACRTKTFLALNRIVNLPDDYDTEDETSLGPGGLVPLHGEEDDFGAEATEWKKVINRVVRRLERRAGHSGKGSLHGLVANLNGKKRKHEATDDYDTMSQATEDIPQLKRIKSEAHLGRSPLGVNHMDSIDRDLLGEGQDEDDYGSGSDDSMDDGDEDMIEA